MKLSCDLLIHMRLYTSFDGLFVKEVIIHQVVGRISGLTWFIRYFNAWNTGIISLENMKFPMTVQENGDILIHMSV
jgi:hypothetical protein